MTSSTDKIQAANGGTTTSETEPEYGLSVVRRREGQALSQIVSDALWEANSLAGNINRALRDQGGPVRPQDVPNKVLEVLACLETADHYLRMLDGVIDTGEPLSEAPIPFR
jgi:hypothetical protein